MTSQDFPLPIYPFPHHMLLVHRNIPDLLKIVHQPLLEFGEEQFDHHLFYPSLSGALGTLNSNVPVFCHKHELLVMLVGLWLLLCIPGLHPQNCYHFAWHPSGWVSQIFLSITSVMWFQLLHRQIRAHPPLWLQKHTDLSAQRLCALSWLVTSA